MVFNGDVGHDCSKETAPGERFIREDGSAAEAMSDPESCDSCRQDDRRRFGRTDRDALQPDVCHDKRAISMLVLALQGEVRAVQAHCPRTAFETGQHPRFSEPRKLRRSTHIAKACTDEELPLRETKGLARIVGGLSCTWCSGSQATHLKATHSALLERAVDDLGLGQEVRVDALRLGQRLLRLGPVPGDGAADVLLPVEGDAIKGLGRALWTCKAMNQLDSPRRSQEYARLISSSKRTKRKKPARSRTGGFFRSTRAAAGG